jgi:hypothetical protein
VPRSKAQHCAEEKARYWADPEKARANKNARYPRYREYDKIYKIAWWGKNRERVMAARRLIVLTDDQKVDLKKYKRALRLKKRYGLTVAAFDALLAGQGGRCAICREPIAEPKIAIDHDHVTQEVRGLLCIACNAGLGSFHDSISSLHNAIAYLHGYGEVQARFA